MASSCKKGYYFCNSSQKCKRIPRGHKVLGNGELVREYVSDWRSDLQENLAPSQQNLSTLADRKKIQQGFDNLPTFVPKTETNTETKDGKTTKSSTSVTMVNRRDETRKAISKFPKIDGVKLETDSDGNVPNAGKFAADMSSKYLKKPFVSKVVSKVLNPNDLKSVKKYASGGDLERDVNSANPGSWQFRANIAADEVNQDTQKHKKRNPIIKNVVTNNEELQGGISVEPYTKDTKFLEVETVDIIKPKALNASDWRSELEVVNEGVKYYTGSDRNPNTGYPKGLKPSSGGSKEVPLTPTQNRMLVKGNKKETVSASYDVDLKNLILEIVEADIIALRENGFSYEEVAEFYDIQEDLSEGWGAAGKAAWEGLKAIGKKVGPQIFNYAKGKAKKDIGTVVKFARDPKTWQRANKDIDTTGRVLGKVGNFLKQLPGRVYNSGRSLKQATDTTVKKLKPAVDQVKTTGSDLAKNTVPTIKKTGKKFTDFVLDTYGKLEKNVGQAIINRGRQDVAIGKRYKAKLNIWKDKIAADKLAKPGDKAGDVINVATNTGKKYRKPGNPWDYFWKKDPSKNVSNFKVSNSSQAQKRLPAGKESIIDKLRSSLSNFKSKGGALATRAKDTGSALATRAKDKGSALVATVKSLARQAKQKTKQLTGTKEPKKLTGNQIPDPWDNTTKLTTIGKKSNLRGVKTAALTTGLVAGGLTSSKRKDKITADEKGTFSKSKASGYVVDMDGYDPNAKNDPETIKKINDLTYKQMQKDKEKGPSQGDSSTINDKKVSVTHSSVYGKTPKTPKTTTPKGRTKWVGANTTWVDRHGNVIAPKAKENKKYKYGRTGSHLTPLEQEVAEGAAVVTQGLRLAPTAIKVGKAILAAKGGEKILKDLLGTPDRPKDTDWVNNPKDRTDDELNVRSNQVKDAEKHQDFDKDMDALRKGEKNISPEDKVQRLKDAAKKHIKNKK